MFNFFHRNEKKKKNIFMLETQITDWCNLKCNKCTHFCHLINEKIIAAPDDFENDMKELAKHFHISYIKLLGGEPLLHPEIEKILDSARRHFPNSKIAAVTNGLLIKSMKPSFWEAMRKNDIGIELSKYPVINDSLTEILDLIDDEGVKLYRLILAKRFYDSFNPEGTSNPEKAFACCNAKLMVLFKKKLYPCVSCYRWYYNKINNTSIELPPALDLYNFTEKELEKFRREIQSPLSACRYCSDTAKPFLWEQYK